MRHLGKFVLGAAAAEFHKGKQFPIFIGSSPGAEMQKLVTKMYTMLKSRLAALKKVINM